MIKDVIKQYKLAFGALALLLLGLIAFGLYTTITRSGKEPLTVYLVPTDAKLSVSGKEMKTGETYLTPGKYTIEASRDGYETEKREVTIGQPNKVDIDVALNPITESAKKQQEIDNQLYLDYESRAGVRASQEGEDFTAENPITGDLPFRSLLFTIGYRADTSDPSGKSIIIEIDAASGYRAAAINKISELGYDPSNYKITFRNYESPFENE